MKCSKCGTEIAEGMKSCPICGETSQYVVDSNQTAISDANTEDGFFKKLVAGEYSLFKTYWGLGAFMAILSLLSSIIDFALIDYLVGATRGIWAVAVWNASSKYEGKKVWAVLAKSVVIFGIICEIYIMASVFGVTNKLPFNPASSTSYESSESSKAAEIVDRQNNTNDVEETAETSENDNAGEAVTSRIVEVSVQQIRSDYSSNEVSADEVYKGNIVRIEGIVSAVRKDPWTKLFCIVFDDSFPPVKCIFDKGEEVTLSDIRKGDTVSLVGDCIGKEAGDIVLLHSIVDYSISN